MLCLDNLMIFLASDGFAHLFFASCIRSSCDSLLPSGMTFGFIVVFINLNFFSIGGVVRFLIGRVITVI